MDHQVIIARRAIDYDRARAGAENLKTKAFVQHVGSGIFYVHRKFDSLQPDATRVLQHGTKQSPRDALSLSSLGHIERANIRRMSQPHNAAQSHSGNRDERLITVNTPMHACFYRRFDAIKRDGLRFDLGQQKCVWTPEQPFESECFELRSLALAKRACDHASWLGIFLEGAT